MFGEERGRWKVKLLEHNIQKFTKLSLRAVDDVEECFKTIYLRLCQ